MNILITYKRQQKEIRPRSFESDSGNPDIRELSITDIAKKFEIPHISSRTVVQEYPQARLQEIDEDADDSDSLDVVNIEWNGMFSCKNDKAYRLFLGQRVEIMDDSVQAKSKEETTIFDRIDIEIAAILSQAVYEENPIQFINTNYGSCSSISTMVGLKFACKASFPYLIGITKTNANSETMWVAFKGTQNWSDILTDLLVIPTLSSNGMVHKGFWSRSSRFPHIRFAEECYRSSQTRRRLIFTGHSLGGSVAHLSALRHLAGKSHIEKPQIFSITFGAPFFGNKTVAADLIHRNLNEHFLTIVNCSDCVPNILNLIETASALQATAQPSLALCKDIIQTLLPLNGALGMITKEIAAGMVKHLNTIIPNLKDFLQNMNLEYKPIGTYGFIQTYASESGSGRWEWVINYLNNQLKTVTGTQIFNDCISKKLNGLYSARSQKYTDESLVNHFMIKYIESLKSCQVIKVDSRGTQEVIELKQFNVTVQSTVAVCCNNDLKITMQGDNLDFISSDKPNCLESIPELFHKDSYTLIPEQTQHRAIVTCNGLIPSEQQIRVGPKQFFLHTHFGKISFHFQWDQHMASYSVQRGMFSKLDMNFLIAAFLRSIFAYIHSEEHLGIRDILEGHPTILQFFIRLVQNRSPDKFDQFIETLQKHLNEFARQKSNNESLVIDQTLYNESLPVLQALHEDLSELPSYDFQKSFKEIVSDNPLLAFTCGAGIVIGLAACCQAAPIALTCGKAVSMSAELVAYYAGADIVSGIGILTCEFSSFGLISLTHGTIERLLYQSHINLLFESMGGNSSNCANEEMTESEICKILNTKSISFNTIDIADIINSLDTIKSKEIFVPNTNDDRPTLTRTTDESKYQAFRLLHDVYYIHELRKWMTQHIYISFVGAHRAGKSSLLKSLWQIPAQVGDTIQKRTKQVRLYTLEDSENNKKVHIIDFPGITDPEREIRQFTDQYAICSSFYVIVAQASSDYDSATNLINQITNTNPTGDPQSDDNHVRSRNTSVPFVVIVTHSESITRPIESELTELANDRLKIDRDLICPCFNKEAVGNKNYVNKFKDDNLAGIEEVRKFLTKQFTKVFGKDHNFDQYMNYRYRQN
ncbi:unnamed protein product [Adineta ricciae]|uniref:Fungal lipase-like domain-containing protein n=1 Tax=Adineta ricciae TaxID=249248 RepID=A0A814E9V7_ADIRI|nr:unnamed protein product [Adineta ricciae]CAF1409997.1 unnamed protein product [Adineta ricciae]